MTSRQRIITRLVWLSTLSALAALPVLGQSSKISASSASHEADFFIISSVDLGKKQILLKLPTEVTNVIQVDDSTRYLDKDLKTIKLTDLRAGDTVYITSRQSGEVSVAVTIRKGPMTVEQLRRRYVPSINVAR